MNQPTMAAAAATVRRCSTRPLAGAETFLLGFVLGDHTADPGIGRQVYDTARQEYGDVHPLTVKIGRRFQQLLRRHQMTGEAVEMCADRLARYQEQNLAGHCIGARLDLTEALHDHGRCDCAALQLAAAHHAWSASAFPDPETGLRIAATNAMQLAGCGDRDHAIDILDRNRPAFTGLQSRTIAALGARFADVERDHPARCTRRPGRPEPERDTGDFWRLVLACVHDLATDTHPTSDPSCAKAPIMNPSTPGPHTSGPAASAKPRRSLRRRPSTPVRGDERAQLSAKAAELYPQLLSIRKVADQLGKSPGFVRGLLHEAGVPLRPPNGAADTATPEPAAD